MGRRRPLIPPASPRRSQSTKSGAKTCWRCPQRCEGGLDTRSKAGGVLSEPAAAARAGAATGRCSGVRAPALGSKQHLPRHATPRDPPQVMSLAALELLDLARNKLEVRGGVGPGACMHAPPSHAVRTASARKLTHAAAWHPSPRPPPCRCCPRGCSPTSPRSRRWTSPATRSRACQRTSASSRERLHNSNSHTPCSAPAKQRLLHAPQAAACTRNASTCTPKHAHHFAHTLHTNRRYLKHAPRSLELLCVSHNALPRMPAAALGLPALRELAAAHNQIEELAGPMQQLTSLQAGAIHGSVAECVPASQCNRVRDVCMRHTANMRKPHTPPIRTGARPVAQPLAAAAARARLAHHPPAGRQRQRRPGDAAKSCAGKGAEGGAELPAGVCCAP